MRTNPQRAATTRTISTPEFTHEERLSRRQAAERLVDVAYALTAGATLELRTDGERVGVHIRLSWSGARTPDPRANGARRHA